MSSEKKIVVCGAGVVGCSVAYYLAKENVRCQLVDACGVATQASGKAGGFLARNWCHGPLGKLSKHSFCLHKQLSEELPGTDFRPVNTYEVAVGTQFASQDEHLSWVNGCVGSACRIGTLEDTAQVHPQKLCRAMFEAARARVGTDLLLGFVQNVLLGDDNRVRGVQVSDEVITADVVVIALGPWSSPGWLKNAPSITSQRAHSVVVAPEKSIPPSCLFMEQSSNEVYPRPDGTVYSCGETDNFPLPSIPSDVSMDDAACQRLLRDLQRVSNNIGTAEPLAKQSCYLPISQRLPHVGPLPNSHGTIFFAAGHGCWGILNGPGTGQAVAHMIVDKPTPVDMTPFSILSESK